MLFRRRDKAGDWERLRVWLWPRVSWRRSGQYYLKRTLRLNGTPHAVAMGAAAGAAASCTPLLGVHVVLALTLAWILRGNLLAAAIGTFLGNPLTYPFIWAASYELGQVILGRPATEAPQGMAHEFIDRSWDQLWPLLQPMAVGSVPLGLSVGCAVYFIAYKMVAAYQLARRERFGGSPANASPAGAEARAVPERGRRS